MTGNSENSRVQPSAQQPGWILHERASEYHWKGKGQLSIKTFFGGRAHYNVGCGHYAVDDASYLILNEGQAYTIQIESNEPVESFCLFFASGFAEDIQRTLTQKAERLLDEPNSGEPAAVQFFEKNYAHDRILSPALLRLRNLHRAEERGCLEEEFHDVVERLLKVHQKTWAETGRLGSLRRSTREELYRRVCRARDYGNAMFAETVTLPDLARVACLSPNHLLRSFRQVFRQTPHQFLTERRLREAQLLLTRTDLPVTEICLAVGFESLGSFSTLFRKRRGLTPSQCREGKK
jgi:AraC family transcriptional regulator